MNPIVIIYAALIFGCIFLFASEHDYAKKLEQKSKEEKETVSSWMK